MNLLVGRKIGERGKELLRAIALLPEPFTTRDVIANAKVISSINHFLLQFKAMGYIVVAKIGKHNQPYSYRRGEKFPGDEAIAVTPVEKVNDPHAKRTALEKAYWAMRDGFNIQQKEDDDL